jgi:hypothetical protein
MGEGSHQVAQSHGMGWVALLHSKARQSMYICHMPLNCGAPHYPHCWLTLTSRLCRLLRDCKRDNQRLPQVSLTPSSLAASALTSSAPCLYLAGWWVVCNQIKSPASRIQIRCCMSVMSKPKSSESMRETRRDIDYRRQIHFKLHFYPDRAVDSIYYLECNVERRVFV